MEILEMRQPSIMPSAAFTEWRQRLKLNKVQAARELGLSRDSVHAYELGHTQIPVHVALACLAISNGLSKDVAKHVFKLGG
jgi:DNA-binding XRE family transcriptional regulator